MYFTKFFPIPSWFSFQTTSFFSEHITSIDFLFIYPITAYTPSDGVPQRPGPGNSSMESTHPLSRLQTAAACTEPLSGSSLQQSLSPFNKSLYNSGLTRRLSRQVIDLMAVCHTGNMLFKYFRVKLLFKENWNFLLNITDIWRRTESLQTFRRIQQAAWIFVFLPALTIFTTSPIMHVTTRLNRAQW